MRFVERTGRHAIGSLPLLGLFATEAAAQNTSSVSSPSVGAGNREIEYRFGWVPGEGDEDASFAHRFDFATALNDRQAVKLIAQFADRPGNGPTFRSIGAELLFELTPEAASIWQSGIRFDARLNKGAESGAVGFDWINRWNISDRFQARAMLVASRDWGDGADSAVAFEVRSSVSYELDNGISVALLAFNDIGDSDGLATGGQAQQIGPTLSGRLGDDWSWTAGNLFGISDGAPDNDVRLWISRDF